MRLFIFAAILTLCLLQGVWTNPSHPRDETQFLEDRLNGHEADPHSHHEQFIGEEEADMYDQLPPNIAKSLLSRVVDKIDSDKDGFVSRNELTRWIELLSNKKVHEDADFRWHHYNLNNEEKISWGDYIDNSWGSDAREGIGLDEISDPERGWTLEFVLERERMRWDAADIDKDGHLIFEEFKSFSEPHAYPHMKDVVISDSMIEIDSNNDNVLTREEYFAYVLRGKDQRSPEYISLKERYNDDFTNNRDLNKDGILDLDEFGYWVFPEGFHRPTSEVNFLFQKADFNLDDRLSRKEIVDNHDVFVGSSATDYGEILKHKKDEL
ncbi:Reticulocalbin-3 isoform X1 [Oopsacas minuta]|uniref:Reticulocalbin-3 n=1 Tax=Oopsacas minuta TaxID=111878 RepID=A0AAV7K1A4_9METZ|nr:Reticulocalbin-3 isoform X1 [Oopsacas minuta]